MGEIMNNDDVVDVKKTLDTNIVVPEYTPPTTDTTQPAPGTTEPFDVQAAYDEDGKDGKEDGDERKYKYDKVYDFSEGMAVVESNGKVGFVDENGKEVIPLGKYNEVHNFSEGSARVQKGSLRGFIDKDGKEVVPMKYDYAEGFSEGRAGVKNNGNWGFIDKDGNEIIPLKYDEVSDFNGGKANVKDGIKWLSIDKDGKEILQQSNDYQNSLKSDIRTSLTGRIMLPDEIGVLGTMSDIDENGIQTFDVTMYFGPNNKKALTIVFDETQKIGNLSEIDAVLNTSGYTIKKSGMGYMIELLATKEE